VFGGVSIEETEFVPSVFDFVFVFGEKENHFVNLSRVGRDMSRSTPCTRFRPTQPSLTTLATAPKGLS
jgi:hypothetical protein